MPVVSNTSPLLNLAIISQLSLLHEQFGEIWIPPGVMEELRPQENLPGSGAVREAKEAGWLRVSGELRISSLNSQFKISVAHSFSKFEIPMSDVVIRAENLGKQYRIRHQQERQRYVARRDVFADA